MLRIFNHYVSKMAFVLLLLELGVLLAAAMLAGSLFGPAPPVRLVLLLGAAGVALTRLVVFKSAETSLLAARVLIVGAGSSARECIALAHAGAAAHPTRVIGCVPVPGEAPAVPEGALLTGPESLLQLARRHQASEIVVAVANRRSSGFPVQQLLECALRGVRVIDAATFFEREACQIRIDALQPSYLIYGGGFDQGRARAASKRAFDLLASSAVTVLTLPLMLLVALCIWCDDGGPVFYVQERVGKDGAPFRVLKFRSMRTDAELAGMPVWASADDPRVTRVGRLIRQWRIDELPQMLNVLRGEMSFVGPRPERAHFVGQLAQQVPYYEVRHRIKPGVTGLAQVRFRYGASVDDAIAKLQYDLYYVKNHSLFLDLLILIATVRVVCTGQGSR